MANKTDTRELILPFPADTEHGTAPLSERHYGDGHPLGAAIIVAFACMLALVVVSNLFSQS